MKEMKTLGQLTKWHYGKAHEMRQCRALEKSDDGEVMHDIVICSCGSSWTRLDARFYKNKRKQKSTQ